MRRNVFVALLSMGLACLVLLTVLFGWVFHGYIRNQTEQELNMALSSVSVGLAESRNSIAYLQRTKELGTGIRLTWISPSGAVLFDSMADKASMENHNNRPEIVAARETGEGTRVGQSETLQSAMLYRARRLPDGTILRAAVRERTIYSHMWSLLPYLGALFLVALFACYRVSRKLTHDLLHPLHQAVHLVERAGRGDGAEHPLDEGEIQNTDEELRPLVQKIADLTAALSGMLHDLEHQRNMVRLIIENMQAGVVLTDETRRIMALNRSAVRLLRGSTEAQMQGQHLPGLLPDLHWQVPRDKTEVQRWRRGNRVYQVTMQPIYTEGKYYGLLVVFDDRTEVEEREQLRREFTSNVTHELKTPLTSISGFSEVLKEHLFQNDNDVAHFGSLIYKESQRLLALIDDILHLGRIEEKEAGSASWSRVSFSPLIRETVEFMTPVLQEKQVQVRCTLEDVELDADEGLLREMIVNLLDNAVKYNRPGGHVYVRLETEGDKAFLSIRDTGIGIPEADCSRIFERFYRVDPSRSRTRNISGTGLGLAIVKHIVDLHHGTIALESKEGEGTEFRITLPLWQQETTT
ncbi:MAG: sensor histidine kinase [Succiniclasticum sp.]|jgi:two-component system phosphate regulon sensor histidine kinase PhoR